MFSLFPNPTWNQIDSDQVGSGPAPHLSIFYTVWESLCPKGFYLDLCRCYSAKTLSWEWWDLGQTDLLPPGQSFGYLLNLSPTTGLLFPVICVLRTLGSLWLLPEWWHCLHAIRICLSGSFLTRLLSCRTEQHWTKHHHRGCLPKAGVVNPRLLSHMRLFSLLVAVPWQKKHRNQ